MELKWIEWNRIPGVGWDPYWVRMWAWGAWRWALRACGWCGAASAATRRPRPKERPKDPTKRPRSPPLPLCAGCRSARSSAGWLHSLSIIYSIIIISIIHNYSNRNSSFSIFINSGLILIIDRLITDNSIIQMINDPAYWSIDCFGY